MNDNVFFSLNLNTGCPFNGTCLKNGAVVPDTESKCTSLRCVGVQGEDRSIHYGMQTDQISKNRILDVLQ